MLKAFLSLLQIFHFFVEPIGGTLCFFLKIFFSFYCIDLELIRCAMVDLVYKISILDGFETFEL
jgi:hypothetical protein